MAWKRMRFVLGIIGDIEHELREVVNARKKLTEPETEVLWWKLVQLESLVRFLSVGKGRTEGWIERLDLPQEVRDEIARLEGLSPKDSTPLPDPRD